LLLAPRLTIACREGAVLAASGMAATSGSGEVDTSRAFRSVKEAVAVFGERILAKEAQFRPSAIAHGERLNVRENPRSKPVTIVAPNAKLEVSNGSGSLTREIHTKASASYNVKREGTSPAPNLSPVQVTRSAPDDVPTYLVPSSPPFFASSPSLANDEFEEHERKDESDLMVKLSTIKRMEDEAARTRQDVAQLKKRIAEMEMSVATLNARLHRTLSRLAHMEADKAAAERSSIERRRGDMALALWAARRRVPSARTPLGHLMRLGDAGDEEGAGGGQEMARPVARRKVQKRKPIVPLVFPPIGDLVLSNKRTKDKESVYMKELYSLLRLS
jgi:hypothetical protein